MFPFNIFATAQRANQILKTANINAKTDFTYKCYTLNYASETAKVDIVTICILD